MIKKYKFKLVTGEEVDLTLEEAKLLDDPDVKFQIKCELYLGMKAKPFIRRKKDGFTPGWQENIKAYAGGRLEYNKLLKEKGLVEIGYDYIPTEHKVTKSLCANEEFAMMAKEVVPDLSDNEVEAIKTGELFETTKINTES